MASQAQPQHATETQHPKILHNVALLGLLACPILALLPPRKFDIYTMGLIGCTAYSANYLTVEQTGRSIREHMTTPVTYSKRPVALNNVSPLIEPGSLSKDPRNTKLEMQSLRSESNAAALTTELEKTKSSREAWKTQREKEIQDELDAGKGFGDMIVDQIWEVWNWGKKKDDDDFER